MINAKGAIRRPFSWHKAMHHSHSRTAALGVVSGNYLPHLFPKRKEKQTAAETETKMLTMIETLKEAARKRALFIRTRDEIARMPLDVALDLDIYPGDAERIARKAVYGR